jgi:DNA polymerase-3 subunit delta'
MNGNHPDITTIERQGPHIKIEQIRSLQRQLRFKPLEGKCRVIVIDEAQHMKAESANALLKVLEEPPSDNLIILTTTDTTALLPTVVSRCLVLRFQPLPTEEIAAHLRLNHALTSEQARVVAGLAGGSLSRASTLLNEEQLERRRWLLQAAATVHRSQLSDLLAIAESPKGETVDLGQDLEWLKSWIRDLLVYNLAVTSPEGFLNFDFADEIAAVAPQVRPENLLEIFELLCTLQGAMGYNINKRLTLEALFLFLRSTVGTAAAPTSSPLHELGKSVGRTTYG